MDAQTKKGLLDVCVLSVIGRGDSYGYQIVNEITQTVDICESTLYPILKRLEAAGNVIKYSRTYNGRLRRYYSITEKGRERLKEFDAEWQELEKIKEFIRGEGK